MTKAPARAGRTNRHLTLVTTAAVAALIATRWLASVAGLGAH
ncbi:hypothetical protein PV396_18400 [Streptomyces sp. ME02-8801-2C]|nr:hypothetical protein [Streptomyces sp. ME02-8801-2C]MDX3453893.1 hypothetical protein [Streptomyces sp. ME02-8801-2C]